MSGCGNWGCCCAPPDELNESIARALDSAAKVYGLNGSKVGVYCDTFGCGFVLLICTTGAAERSCSSAEGGRRILSPGRDREICAGEDSVSCEDHLKVAMGNVWSANIFHGREIF